MYCSYEIFLLKEHQHGSILRWVRSLKSLLGALPINPSSLLNVGLMNFHFCSTRVFSLFKALTSGYGSLN